MQFNQLNNNQGAVVNVCIGSRAFGGATTRAWLKAQGYDLDGTAPGSSEEQAIIQRAIADGVLKWAGPPMRATFDAEEITELNR